MYNMLPFTFFVNKVQSNSKLLASFKMKKLLFAELYLPSDTWLASEISVYGLEWMMIHRDRLVYEFWQRHKQIR